MSGYRKEKLKSALWIVLCCVIVAAALFGLVRVIVTVTWTARSKDFRREIAADMEYAISNNSMYVSVNGSEPVHISHSSVQHYHDYIVITPQTLPAIRSRAGEDSALIDCGNGSVIQLFDAGPRCMKLSYISPDGAKYNYTLKYYTEYDGWNGFLNIVGGLYTPG